MTYQKVEKYRMKNSDLKDFRTRITKRVCAMCEKKDMAFPYPFHVCPVCLRDISNRGIPFRIGSRKVLGGTCDIHKTRRFNITGIQARLCPDCIDKLAFGKRRGIGNL